MTGDVTIVVPLALTASQIIRGSPITITEREALQLAAELHDLIGEVQARYTRRPLRVGKLSDYEAAFELADLCDAVRRTVLGFWPRDVQDAVAHESCWVMEQLTRIDDDLYDQYLRLHDKTQATDFAESSELERVRRLM